MGFDPDRLPESFRRKMAPDPVLWRHAMIDKMSTDAATAKREEICEREIQEQIRQYLRMRGIYVASQPMNKRSQLTPGTPDFICAHNKVPLAFEAKTPSGTLSDAQCGVKVMMETNGWSYHIVHGVADVKEVLDNIEKSS